MPETNVFEVNGLDLYINPLSRSDANTIQSVNVVEDFFGAKTKRPGLTTFLGTANGSAVTSLFSFYPSHSSNFYLYRTSGSLIYNSLNGTAEWSICGNGTVSAGSAVGHAILGDTLILGDGVGSTRHTTNGTSFTNTTLAPIASSFAQYQNRIFTNGTASDLFYSTTGDATNWSTSGTSDSSSIRIPGAGRNLKVFRANDRLLTTKTSGLMYRWDGFSLVDMSTAQGPSSAQSPDQLEDYWVWPNSNGLYGYAGAKPQMISNAVQRLFYNSANTGVAGTALSSLAGGVHRYNYYLSMGTVTDDFTGATINDCVLDYDYLKNDFNTHSFAYKPTAFHSYKDSSNNQQFLLGCSNGQVYTLDSTNNTDNGNAIECTLQFYTHCGIPYLDKKYIFLDVFFNPGCQARVQYAITDMYNKDAKKWLDIGDVSRGHKQFEFPANSRGKFLFIKVVDKSKDKGFNFYGYSVTFDMIKRR